MENEHKLSSLIDIDKIESSAIEQIEDNLQHDFLIKMAIMPDIHCGYDLPIGVAVLLDGHISPSYVGYDIGCGMTMVNTGLNKEIMTDKFCSEILNLVPKVVPVGVGAVHVRDRFPILQNYQLACEDKELQTRLDAKYNSQSGTLGSGNHFIEFGYNSSDEVCVTIHSGSRGSGWVTADWYMKKARFLKTDSELGQAYIEDMNHFLEYALLNRKRMMQLLLHDVLDLTVWSINECTESMINENHNHAEITEDGVLHRKGATQANKEQIGIIPISPAYGVFVTKGLGNETYLCSSSHGAGRVLSRGKARREINMIDYKESMYGIAAIVDESTIDESPMAYKNPEDVIRPQDGVVCDVVDRIKPLVVIKAPNERVMKKMRRNN